MRRRRLSLIASIVAAVASCGRAPVVEPTSPGIQRVKLVTATVITAAQEISSFGSLSFRNKTEVTATVEGNLVSLEVDEGDRVREGDLLATQRNTQLEMRRDQAVSALSSSVAALELSTTRLWEGELGVEARILSVRRSEIELGQKRVEMEELRRTIANKEQLHSVGGTTDEAMASLRLSLAAAETEILLLEQDLETKRIGLRDEDIVSRGMRRPTTESERRSSLVFINTRTLAAEEAVAQSRVESARTDLRSAEQLLSELEIRAPTTGIVGAKYVERGERLEAGSRVLTLLNTADLHAVFPLPESQATHIAEGARVDVTVEAVSDQPFRASVELVSPVIDPQAGTVTVKALLSAPTAALRPGMFARVRLVYGQPRRVVRIAESAIAQKQGDRARVFTVVNRRTFVKVVTLGPERDGLYEVLEGLQGGESLVDAPSPLLQEGEEIEPE